MSNSSQLLHLLASQQNAKLNQNRASLVQHPRSQSPFVNGRSVINSAANIVMGPRNHSTIEETESSSKDIDLQDDGLSPINSPTLNPKGTTFVICEICDGYITDLYQLKSHMQYAHKVSLNSVTFYARSHDCSLTLFFHDIRSKFTRKPLNRDHLSTVRSASGDFSQTKVSKDTY